MSADAALLARLRELAAIDVDALVGHGPDAAEALETFVDDLRDALTAARTAIAALSAESKGPDPLLYLDAPAAARTSEKGREALALARQRMAARAEASRRAAVLTEAAAALLDTFGQAERRQLSIG